MQFSNTPLLVGLLKSYPQHLPPSFYLLVWDPLNDAAALQVELAADLAPFGPTSSYIDGPACGFTQLNAMEFLMHSEYASSVWQLDYAKVGFHLVLSLTLHSLSARCHSSDRCQRCDLCVSSLLPTYLA